MKAFTPVFPIQSLHITTTICKTCIDCHSVSFIELYSTRDSNKLKELSTFVTECNPGISSDEKLASSSDEDGKFSDGEIEEQNSEEILESFVREINEERLHETEG